MIATGRPVDMWQGRLFLLKRFRGSIENGLKDVWDMATR